MTYATPVTVFVISLPHSSRCFSLHRKLRELGIPFENVEAVDGARLNAAALADVYDEDCALKRLGRPMGRGEIGNALSHRHVCRMVVERAVDIALVFEEDAIIDLTFKSLWQTAHALPAEVDFLSLYADSGFVSRQPSAELAGFGLHRASGLSTTVGYFMRRNYARRFLDLTTRIEVVTDWPLNRVGMGQYLALPMPLAHETVDSVIEPERARLTNQYALVSSRCPRWLRALIYVTYIGYLLSARRYDGLANYSRREVMGRLKHLLAPREMPV